LTSGLYRAEATDGRRAIVVQGMAPNEDPPWPGFKELPDDAFEAVILPKHMERACKVGEDFLRVQAERREIVHRNGALVATPFFSAPARPRRTSGKNSRTLGRA